MCDCTYNVPLLHIFLTGELAFLNLNDIFNDAETVPRGDDEYGVISFPNYFLFGDSSVNTVYVSKIH